MFDRSCTFLHAVEEVEWKKVFGNNCKTGKDDL